MVKWEKGSNVKETFLITFDLEVCIITLFNYLLGLLVIPAINIEKWNKTTPKNNCYINLSSFLCCPFGFESTMVPEVFLDFFLLLIFHRMRKLRESREEAKRRERKNRFFFLAASRLVFTASRKEGKSRKTCGTMVHVTRKRQNV